MFRRSWVVACLALSLFLLASGPLARAEETAAPPDVIILRGCPLAIKSPDVIDQDITLTAFPASEVGDSAELVEAIRGTNDYRLTIHVKVEPQAIP